MHVQTGVHCLDNTDMLHNMLFMHQCRLSMACIPVPKWLRVKDVGLDGCGEEWHKVVQEEVVDVCRVPFWPSIQDCRLVNPPYALICNLGPVGWSHHCDLHTTA